MNALAKARVGKVYLVGGDGRSDPITWKGRRMLTAADSILYDHSTLRCSTWPAKRARSEGETSASLLTLAPLYDILIQTAKHGDFTVHDYCKVA